MQLDRARENAAHKHQSNEKTRQGPIIQFLGLFDTVKKAKGEIDHDISYSDYILHVRQALAINEERVHWEPEIYDIDPKIRWDPDSIVQAWFAGWHSDMGGGAENDGLSLYPLQWMLLECQKYQLVLEHKPASWITERTSMQHPPSLVLPGVVSESGAWLPYSRSPHSSKHRDTNSVAGDDEADREDTLREWKFSYSNGVGVTMYDLRPMHNHGNLQKRQRRKLQKKAPEFKATHEIQLNPPEKTLASSSRRPRAIFSSGSLTGYNRMGTLPSRKVRCCEWPD